MEPIDTYGEEGNAADDVVLLSHTNPTTPLHHVTLTAKPHAFAGAVLTPKHARELTPALVLSVVVSLAEQASSTKGGGSGGSGGGGSASVTGSISGASAAVAAAAHHLHTPSGASSIGGGGGHGGVPPAPPSPSLPHSPPNLGRRPSSSSHASAHAAGAIPGVANADAAFRTIQQSASTDSGFGGGGGAGGSVSGVGGGSGGGMAAGGGAQMPLSPNAVAAKFFEKGGTIQYTVWITEAWRVLGWAEPSAALFWEMTTMYYTLYLAGRYSAASSSLSSGVGGETSTGGGKGGDGASAAGGAGGAASTPSSGSGSTIPPILSVGSNASMGSARSAATRPLKNTSDGDHSSGGASGGSGTAALTDGLGSAPPTPRGPHGGAGGGGDAASVGSSPGRRPTSPANSAVSASRHVHGQQHGHPHSNKPSGSAKELPVWMIGTYLLLHCEAEAYRRNLSGEDERRFGEGRPSAAAASLMGVTAGGVDFNALLMHPGLSPRTRLHAGHHNDNSHCAAYLLRHLRKFLLIAAIPHNVEAIWALSDLAERPRALDPEYDDMSSRQGYPVLLLSSGVEGAAPIPTTQPDADELQVRHDQDHDAIGQSIRLTADDLERLSLVLQPPSGGLIDDPPLKIAELLKSLVGDLSSSSAPHEKDVAPGGPSLPHDGLLLADVEREIRAHLENELRGEGDEDESTQDSDPTEAFAALTIRDSGGDSDQSGADARQSRRKLQELMEESQGYNKELAYTNLRGTTTLLKPLSHPDNREPSPPAVPSSSESASSSGGGVGSGGGAAASISIQANGRLHDLNISNCSDAHMYLLQPFEHATISACTDCTIVVGAVAGLLHIVDCERTTITTAARRVLVSNCFDVLHCVFTPSPPLLVGDNRSCQFAPYNTYYDGLREDLLATGLAAALLNSDGSAYGGADLPQPALQCSSNKWKHPVELAKLEIPQLPGAVPGSAAAAAASSSGNTLPHASGVGADDKALTKSTDDNMQTPVLLPPAEFRILFVPLESEAARQQKSADESKEMEVDAPGSSSQDDTDDAEGGPSAAATGKTSSGGALDSQYCSILADVIQLSPFRLPSDYERRALVKAERVKTLQAAMQTLTPAQKMSLEEELNRGFRDWLVTSGNLRQVLDLVHMDRMTAE